MTKKSKTKTSKKDAFSHFKRDKKRLKGAFTQVSERSPELWEKSRWHDVQLPEFLWVALILGASETGVAIQRLRRIANQWPHVSEFEGTRCQPASLSSIAALKPSSRTLLLRSICDEVGSKSVLAPLCHLSRLPGRDEWVSVFAEDESIEHWLALGDALQTCSQFQSESATHICWCISMVGSKSGQMTAAKGIDEEIAAMRLAYPGNAQLAGGLFRCEAGALRTIKTEWPEKFWEEVYLKLPSAPAPPERNYLTDNEFGVAFWFTSLLRCLSKHFWDTRKKSDDVVHETAFGLVWAAMSLAYEVIELRMQNRFSALAILRTATECAINFSYLATKNDPKLWHRFRDYGSGQAHLIAIKFDNRLGTANCVDRQYIKAFLFEEDPAIFTDIELGDWAGENIRSRAEKGGTKDLYDSYYDYTSSMLHGDWLGAATFGLTWDLNPMHRLQRVPREFPRCLPSVVPDLCRVCNRLLAVLDSRYPEFKFRLPEPQLTSEMREEEQ
jgi:uncharacterized protein DUF5677